MGRPVTRTSGTTVTSPDWWWWMTQPSLLDLPEPRQKVRRRVRDTSRAQYRLAVETIEGRRARVLKWLDAYWILFGVHPTSAELSSQHVRVMDPTAGLLYIRRGLSDLQTTGTVSAAGKRVCRVSGRTVETWKVVSR